MKAINVVVSVFFTFVFLLSEIYAASCDDQFPPMLLLSELDGTSGFVIQGDQPGDAAGVSVSGLGDVNADGIDDLIIGATWADPDNVSDAGQAYVVFGSPVFTATIDLSTLNGTNGFVINGTDVYDNLGISVSELGDVNGDNIDDFAVGARYADPNGNQSAGETYIIYGSSSFPSSLDVSSLNGTNGFTINGVHSGDIAGYSVGGLGDVNNDGLDDILIGAFQADPSGNAEAGESYVVYGSTSFPSVFNLSSLNGSSGIVIQGIEAGDNSGASVSRLGDVNGDGIEDLIVGAHRADPNSNTNSGEAYIIYGSNSLPDSINLSSLNGIDGFTIEGVSSGDGLGSSVAGLNDINGDGLDDILVGAKQAGDVSATDAGESYVIFGSTSFPGIFNLSSLNGSNGFTIRGEGTYHNLGFAISRLGDVNNDGLSDLMVGAPHAFASSGKSYILYGNTSFPALFDLSTLDGNTNGFVVKGNQSSDLLGSSLSSLGDVNADGIDDLIIGAYGASTAGESYVIFGRSGYSVAGYDTLMMCLGDSVFVEGAYQFSGGTYYDTLYNASGCDSLIQTELLIDTCAYYLNLKAMLGGPYIAAAGLMHDGLRANANQLLPDTTPYDVMEIVSGVYAFPVYGSGGGETVDTSIFDIMGNDAIVDWVYLQIRDGNDSTQIIESRSALIQRDGDIVDTDGVSPVQVAHTNLLSGHSYYIVVNHRNHLGVMTANPLSLTLNDTTAVDFSNVNTPTFGVDAQMEVDNVHVLYPGDANADGVVRATGPCSPLNCVNDFQNVNNTLSLVLMINDVYALQDMNMDGSISRAGPCPSSNCVNDFQQVIRLMSSSNTALQEQIP